VVSRIVVVSFACNDGRNGVFNGRARGFAVHGDKWSVDYDADDPLRGVAFSVNETLLTFRIHRASYPYVRRKEWYGNWCWDAFAMKRPAALRLLLALNSKDCWHLSGGDTRVCDWLERRRESQKVAA
jgi:hypothetical protein